MADRSSAQQYAAAAGVVLVVVGLVGFAVASDFGGPGDVGEAFGIFATNGWHDLLRLLLGVVGLACAGRRVRARAFAGLGGLLLLVLAVWGFALGADGNVLGFLPVNVGDDVLHLVLGLLGLGAAAAAHEPRTLRARFAP